MVDFKSYYLTILILFSLICFFFKKKNFLLNETGEVHQNFSSNKKVLLTGGLFIYLLIFYFYKQVHFKFYLFVSLFLILGILSDIKIIRSATSRLFLQITIVIFFVISNEIYLENTRIFILDEFLKNYLFNYLFVSFCILIVLNGSNFIDGLNGLSLGYYILISLIVFYLYNSGYILPEFIILNYLIIFLITALILNFLNLIFLGDSGVYILSVIFSSFLIDFYILNQSISPLFIILLLWYPCFETLFSMIRKIALRTSPMKPDNKHLHQLVFLYILKKTNYSKFVSNNISSVCLNIYNLTTFLIALNFLNNTKFQVMMVLFNIFIYIMVYISLQKKFL